MIKLSSQEDQLLSKTITAEQPELEKRKSEILQQEEELKVQLVNYEKSLLEVKNERASIEKLSFSCSFPLCWERMESNGLPRQARDKKKL